TRNPTPPTIILMDSTCKRRRTLPNTTFITSSGPEVPPPTLQNRSIEFTDRPDCIRRLGQVSTSTVVEEAFNQDDTGQPTDAHPQDYQFYDPLPPLEESSEIS